MNIWVIIPAYNEAAKFGNLLTEVKPKGLRLIVVDDGSTDATGEVARRFADVVLHNEVNLGKGRSLHAAIEYLFGCESFDYVITMDADGQHSPADLDSFVREAQNGAAVVVGDRMHDPVGMPWLRVVTNKIMSRLISRITGQDIRDSQCGFRLIKREVLEKIEIKTRKFEIESEILIKAARAGYRIATIPIKSIYFSHHNSKINPFIDTLRFIRFLAQLRKR